MRRMMAIVLLLCVGQSALAMTSIGPLIDSPSGRVKVLWGMHDSGGPVLNVPISEKESIAIYPAFVLDGTTATLGLKEAGIEKYEVNETYATRGNHSRAVNRCNGVRITLKGAAELILECRAYDDAFAFRFIAPGAPGMMRVPDEATSFAIPQGSTIWHHDLWMHYEGQHQKQDVSQTTAGLWIAPPLTFKLAGGGYGAITEANLVNYPGMALQAEGLRSFVARLGHAHPASYPYVLRYGKENAARLARPAAIAGEIVTPWRVVMLGRDLNELVNCDVLTSLSPPPDPKIFPEGLATAWVKPGRAVWKYLDGGENTYEEEKEFTRMAGELGFEYNVIEGFWSRWSDEELKTLAQYGKERGVGLFVWRHTRELADPAARAALFKRCREAGVAGVKLDFLDHEAKEVVDQYEVLLRETAENHLLVNFHGSNKPTGEERTWPNELTREAVKGMESSKLADRATHDVTLPFTRLLAGPADYTPVHFGERRKNTTWAHQIASGAILTSPLLTYGANPRNLLANPAVEMIKAIPATWDETRVLAPSEIGEVAVFARRSGAVWFLAVMNGKEARTIKVPLDFLGEGEWRTLVVRDEEGRSDAVKVEKGAAQRGDVVEITMGVGGGFVGRYIREK